MNFVFYFVMLIYEISWNWNSWYFFDLTNFLQIVIFGFGIIVHEKMRQFIIVIEKYTKNDDNQNINGFTKVHEKNISWNHLTNVNFTEIIAKYRKLLRTMLLTWRNILWKQLAVQTKICTIHNVMYVDFT